MVCRGSPHRNANGPNSSHFKLGSVGQGGCSDPVPTIFLQSVYWDMKTLLHAPLHANACGYVYMTIPARRNLFTRAL